MRIVGGTLRGRRIPGKPTSHTRPTSDRVREAIASALEARGLIAGAQVLDLYAGTGALAFEALSRGAAFADLVDVHRPAAMAIRRAAQELGLESRTRVHHADVERQPERWLARLETPADLVFLDPPYAQIAQISKVLSGLARSGKVRDGAALVIEHGQELVPNLPQEASALTRYRYGDTGVVLATLNISSAERSS